MNRGEFAALAFAILCLVLFSAMAFGETGDNTVYLPMGSTTVYKYLDKNTKEPVFMPGDELLFAAIVMGEVGHESDEEIIAVAECLLNAYKRENMTLADVKEHYQYDGFMNPSAKVKALCHQVIEHGLRYFNDKDVLFFYGYQWTYSAWHESLDFVEEIGATRFFKEWQE